MEKEKLLLAENKLDKSLKLLVKTSFIVFLGLIISKIFSYAYRIIIARSFGPESYGLFSLALSITLLLTAIAGFGLADGLQRYIPILRGKKEFRSINFILRRTSKFFAISGIVTCILLFLISDFISVQIFHNASLAIFLKVLSLLIPITLFIYLFLAIFRGFEKIALYSLVYNIFNNVVRTLVLATLILMGFFSGNNVIVWSYVIGSLLTLLFSYILCRIKIKEVFSKNTNKKEKTLSRRFFQYSWPMMLYSLISLICFWIDSFSLGYYKSALEVGLYNAAVPIATLLVFIPEIFMQLFFPLITREYSAKNPKLVEQLSKQVTKWIFMATLPIFILIFFFPGAALNILFGAQYIPAQNALRLLLIGSFISSTLIVTNNLILVVGKSKLILFNTLTSAVLNLILNSIFVPMPSLLSFDNSNGLLGASLATLISIIFLNTLFIIQTKKHLSFFPVKRKMITIAVISLIPTALLFYLRGLVELNLLMIIFLAGLFILIYLIALLLSKSLDENDWMIIRVVIRKIFSPLKH